MVPASTDPPGCLIVLIPVSAGMADDVRMRLAHRYTPEDEPDLRDLPGQFAARFMVDELLDGLTATLAQGYSVPLEAAVLGYRSDAEGRLTLVSLLPLPYSNPETRFVSLADLSGVSPEPRRQKSDPRKWIAPLVCEGEAHPSDALAEVYRLVSVWLTGRYYARPPVVIHCTDGKGLDEAYARIARSLGQLVTAYGPVRLLHYGFAGGFNATLAGEWPDPAPEPWAGLMELSTELPAEPEGRPARRAVSVNDWVVADAWSAVFELALAEDTIAWNAPDERRLSSTIRAFWTQKLGNKPEEWEDAYTVSPETGTIVVADGASSGIYCRPWADQLARRFASDRPDARNPAAFGQWVQGLRGEWRASINYPTLHWAKQRKVDEVGAAATLLGLEIGPAEDSGRPWRAFAVGDASLFWVREGRLLASFPVVASDQFGSAPLLVRSNPGFKTLALVAAGKCRPGDRFILATDAVAARLLKSVAAGPGPDWDRFEILEDQDWRKEMDTLRQSHEMVNDDCTLVALQVAGVRRPADSEIASEPANIEEPASETEPALSRETEEEPPLKGQLEDGVPAAETVPLADGMPVNESEIIQSGGETATESLPESDLR